MNHLLMDTTLREMKADAVSLDAVCADLALEELIHHRADARARGVLPIFVHGQPTESEMVDALHTLVTLGTFDESDKPTNAAVQRLRGVLREVLHLRRQVTYVQDVCRRERDARMAAETAAGKVALENRALMISIVKLTNDGATSPDVSVITRTPLNEPPIENRSERWREAGARIEAAEAAGKDADPSDLEIVLEEHLKHIGFET